MRRGGGQGGGSCPPKFGQNSGENSGKARSTTGQTRLNSVAILNIERKYVNMSAGKNVDKIIDIFASRKGRKQYFF